MHDGMPYGRNQGQGQGHSREVDRQSPTGLIIYIFLAQADLQIPREPSTGALNKHGFREILNFHPISRYSLKTDKDIISWLLWNANKKS